MTKKREKPVRDPETGGWTFFPKTEEPITFENKPASVTPTLAPTGGAIDRYGSTPRGRGGRSNSNAAPVGNSYDETKDRLEDLGDQLSDYNKEKKG